MIPPIPNPFQVLVVEDNRAFQAQIKIALDLLAEAKVSAFENGADALAFINSIKCNEIDLALVDIGLPDINGISVIEEIRAKFPNLPILVISVMRSEKVLIDAIRAGAHGYILKDGNEAAIAHAIQEVWSGNYPISPALARGLFKLAGSPVGRAKDATEANNTSDFRLSPREREVLQLMSAGLTYQEVADELTISLASVQTYVRGLYRKLQVHNRQSAVNKGFATGMLSTDSWPSKRV